MATKDDIPTDLALEIGNDIDPEGFTDAITAFFGLAKELARSSDVKSGDWRVIVREGSCIIALTPSQDVPAESVRIAHSEIQKGIEALARGDLNEPMLTEKTVQHARKLYDLIKADPNAASTRIWLSKEPIKFSPELAKTISMDISDPYEDYGTLEGKLRVISDKQGALEIKIQDPLWPRAIPCKVQENQIEEVKEMFRHRVEVSGPIRYDRNGQPKFIRMEKLTQLPDDDTLPSIEDVSGLLAKNA